MKFHTFSESSQFRSLKFTSIRHPARELIRTILLSGSCYPFSAASLVAQTFLSAGSGDFPVPRAIEKRGAGKHREPPDTNVCATTPNAYRAARLRRGTSRDGRRGQKREAFLPLLGERAGARTPRLEIAQCPHEPERGQPGHSRLDTSEVPHHQAQGTIPTRCGQDGRAPRFKVRGEARPVMVRLPQRLT